jgi:hypothetical protein
MRRPILKLFSFLALAAGWSMAGLTLGQTRTLLPDFGSTSAPAPAAPPATRAAGLAPRMSTTEETGPAAIVRAKIRELSAKHQALGTYKFSAHLDGHPEGAVSVAFSPGGDLLASGGGDGAILLWDLKTQTPLATLEGHSGPVTLLQFSPDGKSLASGSYDGSILIWDVAARAILARQLAPSYRMLGTFVLDGKRFAWATYWGSSLHVWEWHSDSSMTVGLDDLEVLALAASPGDAQLLLGTSNGELLLVNPDSGTVEKKHERLVPTPPPPGMILPEWDQKWANRNFVTGLCCLKNGDALITDRDGLWRWDRSSDQIAFLENTSGLWLLPAMNDRFVVRGNVASLALSALDGSWSSELAVVDHVHDIAVSGNWIAAARGGGFVKYQWRPYGPGGIDLYDLSKVPQLIDIERQLAVLRKQLADLPVSPASRPRRGPTPRRLPTPPPRPATLPWH